MISSPWSRGRQAAGKLPACLLFFAMFPSPDQAQTSGVCPYGRLPVDVNGQVVDSSGSPLPWVFVQSGTKRTQVEWDGSFSVDWIIDNACTSYNDEEQIALTSFAASAGGAPGQENEFDTVPGVRLVAASYQNPSIHEGFDKSSAAAPKPPWEILLESAGGAAFITILGGGIIGSFLTWYLQQKSKQREILLSQLEVDKQRRLQRGQIYLDNEIKVITDLLTLVTSSVSKAEDLVSLTSERNKVRPDRRVEMLKYHDETRARFNNASDAWKSGREILGVMLGTFHGQGSNVMRAWTRVRVTVTRLMSECEDYFNHWDYKDSPPRPNDEVDNLCRSNREVLEKSLSSFSQELFIARARFATESELLTEGEQKEMLQGA